MNIKINNEQMLSLAQRQLDAYNLRDLNIFCDCYHVEVEVRKIVNNTLVSKGIDDFRTSYKNFFETNINLNCLLKSRIVVNDLVIDEEIVSGIVSRPGLIHAVAIYGFRDNLIDRVWFVK